MKHMNKIAFLVLAWVGMIFYSSSQPYQKQDMRPLLGEYIDPALAAKLFSWVNFSYAGREISIAYLGVPGFIEFFIRKGAHFSVYFVLGFLVCWALAAYRLPAGRKFWYALLFVAGYAAFDEFHQSFNGDRTPLWQDSVLDTIGGITGIAAFHIWRGWKERESSRN
ncbi:MAG: VanZ family protein [Ectobacillus sp.]